MRTAAAAAVSVAASGCITQLTVTTPPPAATDGAIAPAFALVANDGHTVSLADSLARGPVVLVFYRGYW